MRVATLWVMLATVGLPAAGRTAEPDAKAFPRFRMQEIETGLGVGYAVLLVDINGDGRPDIVVADTRRILWYENPSWKRHIIIEGMTKPDNVCMAAHDIDGDGQLDLALGADWHGLSTKAEGTIQWLKRGKTLNEPWSLHPIGAEPTVHRMRFVDLEGSGKPKLVVAPLLGRHSSPRNNWTDDPVRILSYTIPKDPVRDPWLPEVIDEHLHVVHNFYPVRSESGSGMDLLTASYEGVSLLTRDLSGKRGRRLLGEGNQANPKGSRGSSEIKRGTLKENRPFLATIEPWHGHQVVVYIPPPDRGQPDPSANERHPRWDRHVLDEQLRWGHAVWCADLDGEGSEQLIIGVRDDLSRNSGQRRGIRIYKSTNELGTSWARHIIEDGGVAVEDLAAADLNGDGRIDIVAVGRQTHNIRIYWNEGRNY
jgi:hypothetical protein